MHGSMAVSKDTCVCRGATSAVCAYAAVLARGACAVCSVPGEVCGCAPERGVYVWWGAREGGGGGGRVTPAGGR